MQQNLLGEKTQSTNTLSPKLTCEGEGGWRQRTDRQTLPRDDLPCEPPAPPGSHSDPPGSLLWAWFHRPDSSVGGVCTLPSPPNRIHSRDAPKRSVLSFQKKTYLTYLFSFVLYLVRSSPLIVRCARRLVVSSVLLHTTIPRRSPDITYRSQWMEDTPENTEIKLLFANALLKHIEFDQKQTLWLDG